MDVRIYQTAAEIGEAAGEVFVQQILDKPDCVLGLATGVTPIPMYTYIGNQCNAGRVSLKKVTTFNLDEYCNLPVTHRESYYAFMHRNLFDHTDILEENVHLLNGNADDFDAECEAYEKAMAAAGGVDLQLLGIGTNGHIGFNEPSDEFSDGPFKVKLTESTITSNKIYFDTEDEMPRYALTMGIGDIMRAKKIVFIATGEGKAKAVYDMIEGPVSPKCPASILQNHKDVIVFLDKGAAKLLK
ncbi:MAG: glucosamine-6-phosphate deaminase [Clostridiales bacterium]|nr:glucosamine-6-phosphate deaminase [Clostridiales bacterium]